MALLGLALSLVSLVCGIIIIIDAFNDEVWKGIVALLFFSQHVSDGARGVLAGLPLVPFGGLLSIALMPTPDREAIFRGMAIGIWLGPAIAILFVLAISTYLSRRAPLDSPLADFFVRFAAVIGGWSACGAVVGLVVLILEAVK